MSYLELFKQLLILYKIASNTNTKLQHAEYVIVMTLANFHGLQMMYREKILTQITEHKFEYKQSVNEWFQLVGKYTSSIFLSTFLPTAERKNPAKIPSEKWHRKKKAYLKKSLKKISDLNQ